MSVAGMIVAVRMRMTGLTVIVRMGGHRPYSTRPMGPAQPFGVLIGQYDTLVPRID
jgi:hypothetical protein